MYISFLSLRKIAIFVGKYIQIKIIDQYEPASPEVPMSSLQNMSVSPSFWGPI